MVRKIKRSKLPSRKTCMDAVDHEFSAHLDAYNKRHKPRRGPFDDPVKKPVTLARVRWLEKE